MKFPPRRARCASRAPACSACAAPATPAGTAAWCSRSSTPAPPSRHEVADTLGGPAARRRGRHGDRAGPSCAAARSPSTCAARTSSRWYVLRGDDPALRFELCSSVSGVHYPNDAGRETTRSTTCSPMTHNRREPWRPTPSPPRALGRDTRPATGTSARPTSKGWSSTATPRSPASSMPDDLAGPPAAQGLTF